MKKRSVSVWVVLGAVLLVVACQSYDFEEVTPFSLRSGRKLKPVIARSLKPNLMLLVDKSLSMNRPTDPTLEACQFSDGGTCGMTPFPDEACPLPECPTRISELHDAMGPFLTSSGPLA